MTRVTNLKTQYNTAKFTIFFQNFFIKTLQALVGMLRDVNKIYLVTLIFSFSICILKTKIYDTHNLLLGISLSKGYSIMIDQENFQQRPKRTNCKQLQKIEQCLCKCPNHSPIFTTNFSHSDLKFVPTLPCHFLPVSKSSF